MENNTAAFGRMPGGGAQVDQITLDNGWLRCQVLTYGGAVRSLEVPDRDGRPVDVVLGFDTLEDYLAQDKYMGAIVGRYANRIAGARFTLHDKEYVLCANDGPNSLHGGAVGFDKRVWTAEEVKQDAVTLSLASPDGEEGYPGNLEVRVTYQLHQDTLRILYWARCDQDTVFNPTNHSYFNLSGHASGRVEGQHIRLFSDHYTPIGPGLIPVRTADGDGCEMPVLPVDGTPMDLRRAQPIGARIGEDFPQLVLAGGYDHNWVLRPNSGLPAAMAFSKNTGVAMSVHTDMPGIQFYAGNFLGGCPAGKGGAAYGDRCGFCLETQFYPDSPNRPDFPSCALRAGEEFRHWTSYRFFCRDSIDTP